MKSHRLDALSLMAGLLFLALGVGFLLDALDRWSADVHWVPPLVLIALGLGGVLTTLSRRPAPEPAVEDDVER